MENITFTIPTWGMIIMLIASIITYPIGVILYYKQSHFWGVLIFSIASILGYMCVKYTTQTYGNSDFIKDIIILIPFIGILGGFAFGNSFEDRKE